MENKLETRDLSSTNSQSEYIKQQDKEFPLSARTLHLALYRLIFACQFPSVRNLIYNLRKTKDKVDEDDYEAFDYERETISEDTASIFWITLYEILQQHRHKNSNAKKQEERCSTKNKKNKQGVSELELNSLSLYLAFNEDYRIFLNNQPSQFFKIGELAIIFQLSQDEIKKYQKIYRNNKRYILTYDKSAFEKYLMIQFVCVKLKLLASKQFRYDDFPSEGSIQAHQMKIRQYYIKNKQCQSKQQSQRNYFSHFCKKQKQSSQINPLFKQLIKVIINRSLEQPFSDYEIKLKIKDFCKRFQIKQSLSKREEEKVIHALEIIRYYKQSNYKSLKEIVKRVQNLYVPRAKICEYSKHVIAKIKEMEVQTYFTIINYMLKQHIQHEDILFIDHCEYYKQQFVFNNLLRKNKSFNYKPYECVFQQSNKYFSLIIGVTAKEVLFHGFLRFFSFSKYISSLKSILQKFQDHLPKVVVIYIPDFLKMCQWIKLNSLTFFLEEKKILVYLLPSNIHFPNVIGKIQAILKEKTLTDLSHLSIQKGFGYLLQAYIKVVLQKICKSNLVELLTKRQWKFQN